MTAVKSGLMIIDQHRAHVRVLFEQYLRQLADRTFPFSESPLSRGGAVPDVREGNLRKDSA